MSDSEPGQNSNPATLNDRLLKLEEELYTIGRVQPDASDSEQDLDSDIDDTSPANVGYARAVGGGVDLGQHLPAQTYKERVGNWIDANKAKMAYIVIAVSIVLSAIGLYIAKPRAIMIKYKGKRQVDWTELAKWSVGCAAVVCALILGGMYYTGRL